ncbi:type III restriction enzyme, res subunit [Mycobacterium lentiflavum]|uniref:Type III restriction enzyme, res subunit n=1 Tax=Mycobacterium lentiflavum TaxID=141349 RepID=A0A0E4H2G8_MYCLN|nr:DEAD/DEAH box helicase family protein [Mycobacterium lentiflavum]CQD22475.1 type III restriction enzyme, res subunit [Mycobacterium lentiflavum]
MSNFAFLQAVSWSEMHADCTRAESYATSDPRSACFYSRRTIEHLVDYLYEVLALPIPYKNDLAAKINDAAFKSKVGLGITTKLNLIRKLGNTAVHDTQPIPPRAALDALRELHHVMLWAAFRYSTKPQAVPMKATFDPKIAARAAPLTRQEVAQLAAKFAAQDEAHARTLAEKDELAAQKDAEIAALREAVKQAQAANQQSDDRDYNEAETRDRFIDVMLAEAGWPLTEARDREYPVAGMPSPDGKGFVDYVLWGEDGLPLAIVEAKRTTKSPQVGQQQAKLYADSLEKMTGRRPVIFYTNGFEHWIWDDAGGYPPREIQGFYTRDELELMIQRRQTHRPLTNMPIDSAIVERHYQHRAIRAIDDAFTTKQREALLVMATGSGKTRTVIALVKQLMEANWVKRLLFLADRTALVSQAANAFKAHLPDATTVNLVTEKITDGRVYVCTYPTMMNLINDTDSGIRKFGPGYFDLVVIDEAHRSVYRKYRAIFDWYDSLLVGLTATPKDEVDHNTYRLFHLEDGVPTDAYSLDDAVKEGFLVPAVGISVGTKFLRQGIRYADLSEEEKDEWDALDWGEGDAPDEVGVEEINRFLFNEDTVDKVLAELMSKGHRVAAGDRLGKTIIFAKNKDHAEFIARRFDNQYPQYGGQFARVITHGMSYAQSLIDDFSVTEKAPHIAISVDMLDTGIDVPDVVNLVFFKLVRSKTKFWQMIGRGTRLRPNLFGPGKDKQNFYVFDFCGNLEYFSQDLPGSEGSQQKSLNQRLFETRLGLITAIDHAWPPEHPDPAEGRGTETERGLRVDVAWSLHQTVAGMNLENFLVRPHRKLVEQYADWPAWTSMSPDVASDVAEHLAGLPSTHKDDDEDAKRFDMLILRYQLAQLEGDAVAAERLREQIQNIATGLLSQTAIPSVAAQQVLLEEVGSDEWWVDVTLPMLEAARRKLRGLVRFLEKAKKVVVYTDFADELSEATLVDLPGITPGTNWERFQAKARAYLKQHQDHIALQRLRRNKPLTPDDLASLEQMLIDSGTGEPADIELAKEQSHGLGLFVRSLVGLDREAAAEAFGAYLDGARFNADQIRFINLIVTELTANGFVEPVRLYEFPYTDHAPTGPDDVFLEADVENIVAILNTVRDNATTTEGAASRADNSGPEEANFG